MSSTTQFIEVNSRYRNRSIDPSPGSFTILSTQSGRKDRFQAVDPVSEAAPKIKFSIDDFNVATSNPTVVATISAFTADTSGASSSQSNMIVQATADVLHQEEDYYVGAIAEANADTIERNRIVEWDYDHTSGGNDFFRVVVSPAFSTAVTAANTLTIRNPSDITDVTNASVFLPEGEETLVDNFYIGNILWNQTRSNFATVEFYDGTTHLLQVSDITGLAWATGDTYILRRVAPNEIGTAGAATTTTVTLAAGSSTIDDYYVGSFFRDVTAVNAAEIIARIVDYDGTTRIATLSPALAVAPADAYEILQFSYDNYVPMSYNGSITSIQNSVCYEIQLLNLVVPNVTLANGYGGRIVFYPYIYVVFNPVGSSMGSSTDLIYSNNPNATHAIFRVPIDDVPSPLISSFISLDGTGMVQTIKFNPNTSYEFQVLLPTGEALQTVDAENVGPEEPNPLIQISALFSFKRV